MLYRFAEFELDTDRFELRRHGAPLHIEHKVLDLLRYLIEHRARVVPRAELVRALWPDTAVGPNSLNQALYTLRQRLGDEVGAPVFVRTIRGRGLQFVTEVRGGTTGIPTETPHVGRDREMQVLAEALHGADLGTGAVCLAVGQAGIGKSRMLEEFARLAQASSLVRVGRCAEDEGRVAFRPWMQILRHESRDSTAAELAEVDRFSPGIRVGQSADNSNSTMPMETGAARFRWFEALASFLIRRAALRTRVLLIDDLHRADRLSLEFFEFLARDISESRILLVGFARDGELYRSASRDLARVVVSRGGIELEIDALDRLQAQEFLAALGVSDREDELYKRSGGNPLFLQQLARLRLEGASDADRLPDSLRRAALECLAGLLPETRAFLSAAAIEGKEFKLKRVCTALALSSSEGQLAVNEAANAGVIEHDPIVGLARFVHIVMREALVESVGPEAKRDLHRRFWTLQAEGEFRTEGSVARAAHHALEAGGQIARQHGVSLARTAAMKAMRVLDYESAAETCRRALSFEAAIDAGLRFDLVLLLAECEIRSGQRGTGRELLARAAQLAEGVPQRDALAKVALAVAPGFFSFETGVYDDFLVRLLTEALQFAHELQPALHARLKARLAMALYWRGDCGNREALADSAAEMAARLRDPSTRAFVDCARCMALWRSNNARARIDLSSRAIRRARETGDTEIELVSRIFKFVSLLENGAHVRARSEAQSFASVVDAHRLPQARWYVDLHRGLFAVEEGRLRDARGALENVRRFGERYPDQNIEHSCGAVAAICAWIDGKLAGLLPAVLEFVRRYPNVPGWRAFLAMGLMDSGDRLSAARELDRVLATGLPDDLNRTVALCGLAQVACALRDQHAASRLSTLLEPHQESFAVCGYGVFTLGSVARTLGKLRLVCGRPEEALRDLARAQRLENRAGSLVWLADTYLTRSAALAVLGGKQDRDRASKSYALARDLASRLRLSRTLVELEAFQAEA